MAVKSKSNTATRFLRPVDAVGAGLGAAAEAAGAAPAAGGGVCASTLTAKNVAKINVAHKKFFI
jgi:hypothetical protein